VFALSHFKYDNLGRLTASWRDEQANKGEWFGYNSTGQLTDVSYNADGVSTGTPQNATRTVSYTITSDTLNRSNVNDSGDQSNYAPNALNQYQNVAGGDIYYDDKFNLMWPGGFSAGYDSENHLTAIGSGEDYGQFTYDGLGRCLKRTVDWETTLITYDGWHPIVEWDEWNNLKAWNVYGSGPDEILYRHDTVRGDLRYHLDRMGNVVFLLDSDGDGIERYTYDAFGHPTVTDWNGDNPRTWSAYGNRFMFTGREYFPELGLYDFRNRFYYPVLGRFLQSDPMGFDAGDTNFYRYCGGDPVNGSDPFGFQGEQGWANDSDRDDRPYFNINRVWVFGGGGEISDPPFDWADPPLDNYFNRGDDLWGNDNWRDPNALPANPFTQPINLSLGSPNTSAPVKRKRRSISLSTILRANVGSLKPPLLRALAIAKAYPRAIQARTLGHQMFPGTQNSSARHQWAAGTLTTEFGPTTTRDLGVLNEVQGFLWHDLGNLPSRLRGQTAWAFEFQDILDNELGILEAMEDDD
jgi:RHS repeat-associated protein